MTQWMIKRLLLLIFLVVPIYTYSQYKSGDKLERGEDDEVLIVEVPAAFPGGMSAFYQFLGTKMRYPEEARRLGLEGRVYVRFEIDNEGNIDPESVTVVRGAGKSLDEEAIRVVKLSPKWSPGLLTEDGPAVRQRMVLPIIFKLNDQKNRKRKRK